MGHGPTNPHKIGDFAMTTTVNMSAREAAQKFINARTKKSKTEIRDFVAARAKASKRTRWQHLLKAIDAGDTARIKARADADWSAVNAARAEAEPKAPAKSKAKTPAKQPKAADPVDAAAKALGVSPEQLAAMAAFLKAQG